MAARERYHSDYKNVLHPSMVNKYDVSVLHIKIFVNISDKDGNSKIACGRFFSKNS